MKKTFFESLSGGYDPGQFLGFFAWALIGAFIMICIQTQSRDPKSLRTPVKFSWIFWLRDNVRRVVFNIVLILVCIRFSQEVLGKPISDFGSLIIGLSLDGLAILINKFKLANLIGTSSGSAGTPPGQ
jgi:hypothetical protein